MTQFDNSSSIGRIQYLDIAKIAVAFLVVFTHLYSYPSVERLYIYSFHMPLFFIVSGMFHKYRGYIQIKKYVRTILIPALFFIVLYDIIFIIPFHLGYDIVWSGVERGTNIFHSLWNVLLDGRKESITKISGNGVCWFLLALFWCKVFTDCIKKKMYLVLFLTISIVSALALYLQDSIFHMIQCFIALPFYYIGFLYKDNINRFVMTYRPTITFAIGLILLSLNVFLTTINGRVSVLGHTFGNLHLPLNVIVFYLNAFIGSIGVFCLAAVVKVKGSYPQRLANSLISIVGLQQFFITPFAYYVGMDQAFSISLFASIIIVALCYIGHSIIMHLCPQVLGKKRQGFSPCP